MAQNGSIKLPVDCTTSQSGSKVSQDQPAKAHTLPPLFSPQPHMDENVQRPKCLSQLRPEPRANDDDEVQFVFSVPRRRKRKRKRFDFSYSTTMLGQCPIPPTLSSPEQFTMTTPDPLGRRSLGVLEQLESCHLGTRESKNHVVRGGSLPIAPSITSPVRNTQRHPNFLPALQPLSSSSPIPMWNESRPLALTSPVDFPDLRPPYADDSVCKKRKIDSDLAAAETRRLIRQSSYISPRTTPVSILPPSEGYTRDLAMDTSDTLWTWSLPSMSENPPSDPRLTSSWSDFDWNSFDNFCMFQHGSQTSHEAMAMDVTGTENQRTNLIYQPRTIQSDSQHICQQNNRRESSPQAPHPCTFESSQTPRPFQNTYRQVRPQQILSHGSTTAMDLCFHTPQKLAVTGSKSYNGTSRASANLSSHPRAKQRKQPVASLTSTQINSPQMQMESTDLLRKPSLYNIPAWPTPDVKRVQMPIAFSSPHSRPPNPNTTRKWGFQDHIVFNTLPKQSSKNMQSEKSPSGYSNNKLQTETASESSRAKLVDRSTTEVDHFELPRARADRKHCPNLIVDIAETCQELFPFAEVADRHSVPIKKVFDTFSAIIQLPLLRNADDRRRHGSVGKRRMKEYRDAKKAMEKAQEAERKTQMKDMKARLEKAEKKGKGQANTLGLLKAAIMNNATQSQAGPNL